MCGGIRTRRVGVTFSLIACWCTRQLVKDWKLVGDKMMLVHHIVFPLTYGLSLYFVQPTFGTYTMSVFQVRPPRGWFCKTWHWG